MPAYAYGVIECFENDRLNVGISHWVFKTITEANAFKERMQNGNPEFTYYVLHLNKR